MINLVRRMLIALSQVLMFYSIAPAWAGDPPAVQQAPATAAAAGTTQSAGLAIVAGDGVQPNGPNGAFHDYGTIDSLTTKRLEQVFHLQNSGTAPIDINYVQPSCGCQSIVLSAENGKNAYTIAPGAQFAVRITMDLNRIHSGHFAKAAMVYVKGSNTPAFVLEMRGDMPPLIAYSPRVLDFGRLSAGVGRTLSLTVTIDKRLIAINPPPKLICNNPDIQITPQPGGDAAPATNQNDKSVTRIYSVTLARNARIGAVGGAVAFVPGDSAASKQIPTQYGMPGIIPDALDGMSAILSGQIIGKFYAAPYILVMGGVHQGTEITRRILLVGETADLLQNLTFTCSVPTMSARLLPQSDAASVGKTANDGATRATAVVEIKLDAKTPAGGLNGDIVITAADGERFVVTVLGDVVKPPDSASTSSAHSQ